MNTCIKMYLQITELIALLNTVEIFILFYSCKSLHQKQPSRGVHRKRCSRNMQQIYRRTPMPNHTQITPWHECSPVNLLPFSGTSFPKKTSDGLLLLHQSFWIEHQHLKISFELSFTILDFQNDKWKYEVTKSRNLVFS